MKSLPPRYGVSPSRISEVRRGEEYRAKQREASRRWQEAHLEKALEEKRKANKRWREAHPEQARKANREAVARWTAANREKALERKREASRRWREANPKKVKRPQNDQTSRVALQLWREANPERNRAQVAAAAARRRAVKAGVPVSCAPAVIDFYEMAGSAASVPCFYCGRDPGRGLREVDHKTPFARGGPHSIENLAVSCKPCNSAKSTMTSQEFLLAKAA